MLAPIDNAIGFIGNLKLTGPQLVRAEEVYADLINFRSHVTLVEDDESTSDGVEEVSGHE